MSRNHRKRISYFLSVRKGQSPTFLTTISQKGPILLRCVTWPLVTSLAYAVLWRLNIFSLYLPILHILALFILVLWIIKAIKGSSGFWPRYAHFHFLIPTVFLVLFGSSWISWHDAPVKAWVTPPSYTHQPTVPLSNNLFSKTFEILEGSQVHISWGGDKKLLEVIYNEHAHILEFLGAQEPTTTLLVSTLPHQSIQEIIARIRWQKIGHWRFRVKPDKAPQVGFSEEPTATSRQTFRVAYTASDDYGVESVTLLVTPTASETNSDSQPIEIQLSTPRARVVETANYIDLSSLPWAGSTALVQLIVTDGAGQKGWSAPKTVTIPMRQFKNPFARALIEEREKLLQDPNSSTARDEAANVMAGIARQQSVFQGDSAVLLALRASAVRLVINDDPSTVPTAVSVLWHTALRLEEGTVGHARNKWVQAQSDLFLSLIRGAGTDMLLSHLDRMGRAMVAFFEALDNEKKRRPPVLQEVEWPLITIDETITPQDIRARLIALAYAIKEGRKDESQRLLEETQIWIENLQTTPPELSPIQARMAHRAAVLRAIVRGQKGMMGTIDEIGKTSDKAAPLVPSDRSLHHQISQQQSLISALHDMIHRGGLIEEEAKTAEIAMSEALEFLRRKKLSEARVGQTRAVALLENCLLTLSEQMRRAQAPQGQ